MTNEDYELSERMLSYWTNFMKVGDPNSKSLPDWKHCSIEESFVLNLDV